jgi:hypothetical protein
MRDSQGLLLRHIGLQVKAAANANILGILVWIPGKAPHFIGERHRCHDAHTLPRSHLAIARIIRGVNAGRQEAFSCFASLML